MNDRETAADDDRTAEFDSPAGGGGPRLKIAHAMVFVVMAASASALFAKLYRMFGESGADSGFPFDIATLTLLGVGLSAAAIGLWRRSTPNQVMLQVALCCVVIYGLIEVFESHLRIARYWLQFLAALLIVLPLALRRGADRPRAGGRRREVALWTAHVLLCCGLSLALALIGAFFQYYVIFTFLDV